MFLDINISQGSVATPLRCGGIGNDLFIANFLLSVTVKEFLKNDHTFVEISTRVYSLLFWATLYIYTKQRHQWSDKVKTDIYERQTDVCGAIQQSSQATLQFDEVQNELRGCSQCRDDVHQCRSRRGQTVQRMSRVASTSRRSTAAFTPTVYELSLLSVVIKLIMTCTVNQETFI